jgi:hypothetical protein
MAGPLAARPPRRRMRMTIAAVAGAACLVVAIVK